MNLAGRCGGETTDTFGHERLVPTLKLSPISCRWNLSVD
jgi:hypothetical protein